ncbi:hypothetical protein ACFOD4_20515 [Pseudoroseomonas globiformis]|uniref:Uncharacterized protein n=1 Tax=Teichococcus globiformis TaxID=2307229 RepID=A0ABV7G4M3_9PROT
MSLPEGASGPTLLDLMETEGMEPRTLAMLRLLLTQQAASTAPAAHPEVEELRARLVRLEGANTALLAFTECLAGALGACPACWGADPGCACGGAGHPGTFPPERGAFEAFVLPVIRALGPSPVVVRHRLRAAGPGTGPQAGPGFRPVTSFNREP